MQVTAPEDLPSVYKASDLPAITADLKLFYRAEISNVPNPNYRNDQYKQMLEQKYGMSIYTLEKMVGYLRKKAKSPKSKTCIEQLNLPNGFDEEILTDWYQKMKPGGSGAGHLLVVICALIEEIAELKNIPLKKHNADI